MNMTHAAKYKGEKRMVYVEPGLKGRKSIAPGMRGGQSKSPDPGLKGGKSSLGKGNLTTVHETKVPNMRKTKGIIQR